MLKVAFERSVCGRRCDHCRQRVPHANYQRHLDQCRLKREEGEEAEDGEVVLVGEVINHVHYIEEEESSPMTISTSAEKASTSAIVEQIELDPDDIEPDVVQTSSPTISYYLSGHERMEVESPNAASLSELYTRTVVTLQVTLTSLGYRHAETPVPMTIGMQSGSSHSSSCRRPTGRVLYRGDCSLRGSCYASWLLTATIGWR